MQHTRSCAPAEEASERLVRSLNDAWAVAKGLGDTLQGIADEVTVPALRAHLEDHGRLTRRQQQSLEARLRTLGKIPSGGKGLFDQMMLRVWDALSPPRDEIDRTWHALLEALGAVQFKATVYQALETFAEVVGDGETAQLARIHLRQEQAFAE